MSQTESVNPTVPKGLPQAMSSLGGDVRPLDADPICWNKTSRADITSMFSHESEVWPDKSNEGWPFTPEEVEERGATICGSSEPKLHKLESELAFIEGRPLDSSAVHFTDAEKVDLHERKPKILKSYVDGLLTLIATTAESKLYSNQCHSALKFEAGPTSHFWEPKGRYLETSATQVVNHRKPNVAPLISIIAPGVPAPGQPSVHDKGLPGHDSFTAEQCQVAILAVMSHYKLKRYQCLEIQSACAVIYFCGIDDPKDIGRWRKARLYKALYSLPEERNALVAHMVELLCNADDFLRYFDKVWFTIDYTSEDLDWETRGLDDPGTEFEHVLTNEDLDSDPDTEYDCVLPDEALDSWVLL